MDTTYRDLDINSKINLKGLLDAWTAITVERFQKELNQKVYGVAGTRTTKRGIQSTRLNRNYRFGAGHQRTNQLRLDWRSQVRLADARSHINLSFLMYGRFVDMGVGKGVDSALARYARVKKNGETITRRPKKWYSKRKGYETHRLTELLKKRYVGLPIALVENALDVRIGLTI